MELQIYLEVLLRRKMIILATTLLTLATAAIGSFLMTPTYEASTLLRVTPIVATSGDRLGWDDIQYGDRLMNTYVQIATSEPMLDELARRLGRGEDLSVEVEVPANTELLQIRVEDPDAAIATQAANMLAEMFVARIQDDRQQDVTIIAPASVPDTPEGPQRGLIVLLGLALGLVAGVGLAFLFESLDPTLHSTQQIQQVTGMVPIGKILYARPLRHGQLFEVNSPESEAFRQLRTSILRMHAGQSLSRILVTSAEPGEGKSTIVSNLALVIAQAGQKVIVVDCDLRLPSLHTIFKLSNETGLSSVLQQQATLEDVIRNGPGTNVWVITSGPQAANPAELLGSLQMEELIGQLVQQFDIVLLDSPSLLAVTDAAVLAPLVEEVVLVVGRAQARPETIQAARQQLALVHSQPVRLVVNRAEVDHRSAYYHHKAT